MAPLSACSPFPQEGCLDTHINNNIFYTVSNAHTWRCAYSILTCAIWGRGGGGLISGKWCPMGCHCCTRVPSIEDSPGFDLLTKSSQLSVLSYILNILSTTYQACWMLLLWHVGCYYCGMLDVTIVACWMLLLF